MPRYKQRRGPRPDITEALGPLPFQDDPVALFKTVLATFSAYDQGKPVEPMHNVIILRLATVGLAALEYGGKGAVQVGSLTKCRHPAAIVVLGVLDRFSRCINGCEAEFERIDVGTLKFLTRMGLEAIGFLAPPPAEPRGRPPTREAAECARFLLAKRHDEILAGHQTVAKIIKEAAKWKILRRRREQARNHGRDPNSVSLGPSDELEIESVRRKDEVAYYRAGPLTEEERSARIMYTAVLKHLLS